MINILNAWKNIWFHNDEPAEKMPLTEKDAGEEVPYPYPVKKVRINESVEIAYIDEGDKDAEEVILFLHGMGGGVPGWRKNIPALKKRFRCIALDLPGHGHSCKGDFPYTITFYTEVVLSFIKEIRLPPVTLVGHSLGGHIAIMAALREPSLIHKLILVSPAGIEPFTPLEKQTLINMSAGMVVSGQAFTQHRFNHMVGFCNDQEAAGDLLKRLAFFKEDAASFGRMMLRTTESILLESVNHVLDKITQPCLVLVGKEDKLSPYNYLRGAEYFQLVEQQAAKIPNGKLVVFSPCGHYVEYQRPEDFNKVVLEFLKEKEVV